MQPAIACFSDVTVRTECYDLKRRRGIDNSTQPEAEFMNIQFN